MGVVLSIILAAILGFIIFKKPYVGLIIVIVSEFAGIGTLIPDLGAIRFPGLMVGFLILRWIKGLFLDRNIEVPSYQQNWAQLGFLFVMGMSVLFAYLHMTAFWGFLEHLGLIILYFIIISLLDTQYKLKRFILAYLLVNAYLAYLGLYNYFVLEKDIDNLATGGFTAGGDDFAVIISAAIPFSFYLYQAERSMKLKLFYGLLTIVFTTAVICAFSRGGWVTLIGTAFLLTIFSPYRLRTVTIILIAFLVIFYTLPPRFADEFNTIFTEYSTNTGTTQNRFELWKAGFQMFLDHPIIGVGMLNFAGVYGRFYIPKNAISHVWNHAHSIYFTVIAELGLLGLVFFVLIVYWIIKDNRFVIRKFRNTHQTNSLQFALSQSLMVSLLGYLLGGVFLSILYYPPLYIMAALTVALRNTVEKEEKDSKLFSQSMPSFVPPKRLNYAKHVTSV